MACLPKAHKRISRYASVERGKLSDKAGRIHELWNRDKTDLIDLVEIGALLAYHKHRVGHRKWLKWIEKLPFSDRTARAYMLLFRAYGDGYDHGYEDADLLLESHLSEPSLELKNH